MGRIIRAGGHLNQIGDMYYRAIQGQWLDHLTKTRRKWFVLNAPQIVECLSGTDAARLNRFFSEYETHRKSLGLKPAPGYLIIEDNERIYPKVQDLVMEQSREDHNVKRKIIVYGGQSKGVSS